MAFDFSDISIEVTRFDYSEEGSEQQVIIIDKDDIESELDGCGYDSDKVEKVRLVNWNARLFTKHWTGKKFLGKWVSRYDYLDVAKLTIDGTSDRVQAMLEIEFEVIFANDEREYITITKYTNFSF
jgi:hypothetical protein